MSLTSAIATTVTGVRACCPHAGRAAAPRSSFRSASRHVSGEPPRLGKSRSVMSAHPRRALATRAAYGESKPDGTWTEKPTNAFGSLINLAKGQREIVQAGTPSLREIAEEVPVKDIDSGPIQELIQEMLGICRGRGVGLAAPQIGVKYRIFVMEDTEEGMSDVSADDLAAQDRVPFGAKVIVNPVVTPVSNASAAFFEGCLSVQGYRGLVRRWLQVRVQGYGGDGKPVDFIAKGWQARIVQHEMDHLNGVLYVDRMDTRTFRRVDKLDEPMPPSHPEFGAAPRVGPCEGGNAGVKVGAGAVEDVEGFIGKSKVGKAPNKKRRSR